jgi:hypothetical protein
LSNVPFLGTPGLRELLSRSVPGCVLASGPSPGFSALPGPGSTPSGNCFPVSFPNPGTTGFSGEGIDRGLDGETGGLGGIRNGAFFFITGGRGNGGLIAGFDISSGEISLAINSSGLFFALSGTKYIPTKIPMWIITEKAINFFIVKCHSSLKEITVLSETWHTSFLNHTAPLIIILLRSCSSFFQAYLK